MAPTTWQIYWFFLSFVTPLYIKVKHIIVNVSLPSAKQNQPDQSHDILHDSYNLNIETRHLVDKEISTMYVLVKILHLPRWHHIFLACIKLSYAGGLVMSRISHPNDRCITSWWQDKRSSHAYVAFADLNFDLCGCHDILLYFTGAF